MQQLCGEGLAERGGGHCEGDCGGRRAEGLEVGTRG